MCPKREKVLSTWAAERGDIEYAMATGANFGNWSMRAISTTAHAPPWYKLKTHDMHEDQHALHLPGEGNRLIKLASV